jgi:outer membrane lipoprotein-sorting protein
MRWLPVLLLVALRSGAAEPNEAENLFRDMEKKLTSGNALSYEFEGKVELGDKKMSVKGSVIIGEGNRGRIEWSGTKDGNPVSMVFVSNGVKMQMIENGKAQGKKDAPKPPGELNRAASRTGVFVWLLLVEGPISPDLETSDFKLGKKEKVGESDAQEIQYSLKVRGAKGQPLSVRLWIDTKTTLPLKRVLIIIDGSDKITFTETYSNINPDAKDPKEVELKE